MSSVTSRIRGSAARRAAAAAGVLLALVATVASDLDAAGSEPTTEPGARRRVEVPGTLLDSAVVDRDGQETLALLVRMPDLGDGEAARGSKGSRDLYLLDPVANRLVPIARGLPESAGRLVALGSPGEARAPGVVAARYGHLELLVSAAGGAAGSTVPVAAFDLPCRAERTSRGLRLTSPAASVLELAPDGFGDRGPCFATEPEARGRRRLRVTVRCPGAAEPEELWMLLPAAETVTASRYLDLDGTPVLAVLTREKLGVFVKQDLRVFALAAGRTRVGSDPLLAVPTGCPLWRDHELTAADADGDGRADVVLLCARGLVDQELRMEVYPSLGAGQLRFDRRGRTMNLDGEYASWRYGADLTGDGLPDLLARRDGWTLALYAGRARGRPVETRPAWTLPVPREPVDAGAEGGGEAELDDARVEVTLGPDGETVRALPGGTRVLAALDLDGDGRREILLYQRLREERGEERTYRGGLLTILKVP
jgi:hypothetical protein